MSKPFSDSVEYRIVIEYGRKYVYLTLCDRDGKMLPGREEVFTQPFLLSAKDAADEAEDTWQNAYQWISDACVFPLQDSGGGGAESGDDPPPSR